MPDPDDQLKYDNQSVSSDTFIRAKEMDHESGLLGKFFGCTKNAPLNIAGLFLAILLIFAAIITFTPPQDLNILDFWKNIVLPLVLLVMGYIFGKK